MDGILSSLGRAATVIGLRLIILAICTWLGFRLIELGRRLFDKRVLQKSEDLSRRARLATLLDAAVRTGQLFLVFVVGLMALARSASISVRSWQQQVSWASQFHSACKP